MVLLGYFLAPGAAHRLYSFVATYILCYDVYLTTRKMLTGENGEGSNACALPCGVGGVGQGVSEVSAMRKIGIPSLVQTRTLHPPGGLNVDPPGSTRRNCHLKSSACDTKQSALPLKQVNASLNR